MRVCFQYGIMFLSSATPTKALIGSIDKINTKPLESLTERTRKVKLTHCCRPLVVGCSIYDSTGVMNGWMWRHIVHLSMLQIQIHTKSLISSGVVSMYCIISCCLQPLPGDWRLLCYSRSLRLQEWQLTVKTIFPWARTWCHVMQDLLYAFPPSTIQNDKQCTITTSNNWTRVKTGLTLCFLSVERGFLGAATSGHERICSRAHLSCVENDDWFRSDLLRLQWLVSQTNSWSRALVCVVCLSV